MTIFSLAPILSLYKGRVFPENHFSLTATLEESTSWSTFLVMRLVKVANPVREVNADRLVTKEDRVLLDFVDPLALMVKVESTTYVDGCLRVSCCNSFARRKPRVF